MAPATPSTLLRAFPFGQLARGGGGRGGAAGVVGGREAGPAAVVIDVDSTICGVVGNHEQGRPSATREVPGYHPLLASGPSEAAPDGGTAMTASATMAAPTIGREPPGGPVALMAGEDDRRPDERTLFALSGSGTRPPARRCYGRLTVPV
jgi:hypothetical protein